MTERSEKSVGRTGKDSLGNINDAWKEKCNYKGSIHDMMSLKLQQRWSLFSNVHLLENPTDISLRLATMLSPNFNGRFIRWNRATLWKTTSMFLARVENSRKVLKSGIVFVVQY